MFVIQYEAVNGTHRMQDFDCKSRTRLIRHLASFQRPIVAVYERTTPITKWAQIALREYSGFASIHARRFAKSQATDTETAHQS